MQIGLAITPGNGGRLGPLASIGVPVLEWWDAASGITITGAGVSSWKGRMNNYDVVQATDANRPTYSATGFNGAPGLTFNGTSQFLNMESQPFPSSAAPSEIWLVVQQDALAADTTTRNMFAYGAPGAGNQARTVQRFVSAATNRLRGLVGTGAASFNALDTSVDFSSRHVVRCIVSATDGAVEIDGGAATTTSGIPATLTTRVRVGSSIADTAGGFWNGKIRDIIVTGALTPDQATALETFLPARRML